MINTLIIVKPFGKRLYMDSQKVATLLNYRDVTF